MSLVKIQGNASGTGVFTVASPNSNTDRTLTLPDSAGVILNNQSDITAQVKTATSASGDAPIYSCRAWVNFNGTGTVAIRASGNVSSITDNGTGDYLVNLTTAMPDTNYCVCSSVSHINTANQYNTFTSQLRTDSTTSAVRILTGYNPAAPVALDCVIVAVAVFR